MLSMPDSLDQYRLVEQIAATAEAKRTLGRPGRLAVDQITPFTLVFLRWVMVIGVLWPIYGGEVRKYWPEIRPRLRSVVLMAVLGAVLLAAVRAIEGQEVFLSAFRTVGTNIHNNKFYIISSVV